MVWCGTLQAMSYIWIPIGFLLFALYWAVFVRRPR